MKKSKYLKELRKLQEEIAALQDWVKDTEKRIIIVFEGRDGAGKGGVIKAITQRVSHRVFRVEALPAPSDRERKQMYMQRYIQHFPSGGEVVIFDRSWYNRAGVEPVMGFCSEEETQRFLEVTPLLEQEIVKDGTILLKYWLEVSSDVQKKRMEDRIEDPVKQWKLGSIDLESRRRWYSYSKARDRMLEATDTETNPWHIVKSDNKFEARLNCISHMLDQIPYQKIKRKRVSLPKRDNSKAYDDQASMSNRRYVMEKY